MPLYEYKCEACGARFEVIQRFSDAPVESCKECGGPVERMFSAPAIQFKGSGWYITDYARKGAAEATSSNGSNGNGAGPSAKKETKTESTPPKTEKSKDT